MVTGTYERELRGVLSGDEEMLASLTKTCTPEERSGYYRILGIPFMVVRAGGSLGIDLIAVRGEVSFPIEVKSSKKSVVYFSDEERLTEQAEQMIYMCTNSGVIPLYAFRLKGERGDKWRIFTLDIPELTKKQRILNNRLPHIETTSHGNYKMDWHKGMALNNFISYLEHLIG